MSGILKSFERPFDTDDPPLASSLFMHIEEVADEKQGIFAWSSELYIDFVSLYTHMQSLMAHSHAVSGCKVSMDKILLGQVGHSQCYLMAHLQ